MTDNLEVAPGDFTPFCITAPADSRLPGGGGYQVCGLYDVVPQKFGRVNNLVTQASNYYGSSSKVNCGAQVTLAATGGALGGTGGTCGTSDFFGVNATYGRQWSLPVAATVGTEAILQGRLIQLGGQLTF